MEQAAYRLIHQANHDPLRLWRGRGALSVALAFALAGCGGGLNSPNGIPVPLPAKALKTVEAETGALSTLIPEGYYDGTVSCSISDPNLISSNIVAGQKIFGVTGSAALFPGCAEGQNAGQCSTQGPNHYVTTTLGEDISGENGALDAVIPAGYYDGSTKATMSDENLRSENILYGVTIFGKEGNVAPCAIGNQVGCVANATFPSQSTPASPAIAANVLSGKQFYAGGAMVTGSMEDRGSPTITPTTSDQNIDPGYYSGGKVKGDPNLVSGNILSSVSIFGVPGGIYPCASGNETDCLANATFRSQSIPDDPAIAANVLSGKQFYAGGAMVTGSMEDRGSPTITPTTSDQNIDPGYYSGGKVKGDPNLVSGNILSSVSIFGVTGNVRYATLMPSGILRNEGVPQITIAGESAELSGDYPSVPDENVHTQEIRDPIPSDYTYVSCGQTGTLTDRVASCNLTWDGTTRGGHAEGAWKLVTSDGTNEIWKDTRTALLWSDDLGEPGMPGWCKASGNPTASACTGNAESWCADTFASAAKGGLNLATSPKVRWRLPTREDWLQAELDGIRGVKYTTTDLLYWSSTALGSDASEVNTSAWVFRMEEGWLFANDMSGFGAGVRVMCVGTVLPDP